MEFHSPGSCQRRGNPSCFTSLCLFPTVLCLLALQTASRRNFIPAVPVQNTACGALHPVPCLPLFSFPLCSTVILGDTAGVPVTKASYTLLFLPSLPSSPQSYSLDTISQYVCFRRLGILMACKGGGITYLLCKYLSSWSHVEALK